MIEAPPLTETVKQSMANATEIKMVFNRSILFHYNCSFAILQTIQITFMPDKKACMIWEGYFLKKQNV